MISMVSGENLGLGELGGRSTLANAASFEPVVYQAEDGNDEGVKIHEREDLLYAGWFGRYRA